MIWWSNDLSIWGSEDLRIWGSEDLRIWGSEDLRPLPHLRPCSPEAPPTTGYSSRVWAWHGLTGPQLPQLGVDKYKWLITGQTATSAGSGQVQLAPHWTNCFLSWQRTSTIGSSLDKLLPQLGVDKYNWLLTRQTATSAGSGQVQLAPHWKNCYTSAGMEKYNWLFFVVQEKCSHF